MASMETIDSDDETESHGQSTAKYSARTPRSLAPTAMRGQFSSQFRGMKASMLKENLALATRLKSKKDLQKAIKDYIDSGLAIDDCVELAEAGAELDVIRTREAMKRAVIQGDPSLVRSILEEIKEKDRDIQVKMGKRYEEKKSFKAQLQMDIQKANRFLNDVDKKRNTSHELNRAVMTEVSAYSSPPRGVHATMQAILLLMGEDEYATSDWQFCARVVHPREFQKRLMKFDPNDCHPSFVARACQILDGILYEDIFKASRAGATFYVFAIGTIEEYETLNGLEGVKPAKVAKQRELLERPWPMALPKSSKSERTRVEKPRVVHQGFTSYKQYF